MVRLRRWSALALLLVPTVLLLSPVRGEPPTRETRADDQPAEKWLVDHSMTVSAAPASVPALRYRLFPASSERKEGNAIPMYLRLGHERTDAWKKQLREKPAEWNKLPLDKLPLREAKEYLSGHEYNLKQIELGARRKTAEWSYALDVSDLFGIHLSDVQEIRQQAPLLILKARVEIAEGRYDDAIRTLETGFSFSEQISEAPFLIHGLIGVGVANLFADCLLELIERADSPNVYWALSALPRPLVDMRRGNEFEYPLLEMQFPDMADLSRPRPAEEWDAALRRVRTELERIDKFDRDQERRKRREGNAPGDPAAKSPDLPAAKKYLTEVVKLPADQVDKMPPAQVLLLYLSHFYHEYRDDVFKVTYLPFPEAREVGQAAYKRLKDAPDTDAGRLVNLLLPAVHKTQLAQVRLERKIAALRAIEALRLHVAANQGQIPDRLDQVKVAPVPNDPGTGQPFEYKRDGQTFTLTSRIPGEPLEATGLRYRVTIRK